MKTRKMSFHKRAGDINRRHKCDLTAQDLFALWHRQRGRCALTGDKLDRDAQVDHIVPVKADGGHGLSNLRWVSKWANIAKRDMLDHEFLEMCQSCLEHSA